MFKLAFCTINLRNLIIIDKENCQKFKAHCFLSTCVKFQVLFVTRVVLQPAWKAEPDMQCIYETSVNCNCPEFELFPQR